MEASHKDSYRYTFSPDAVCIFCIQTTWPRHMLHPNVHSHSNSLSWGFHGYGRAVYAGTGTLNISSVPSELGQSRGADRIEGGEGRRCQEEAITASGHSSAVSEGGGRSSTFHFSFHRLRLRWNSCQHYLPRLSPFVTVKPPEALT